MDDETQVVPDEFVLRGEVALFTEFFEIHALFLEGEGLGEGGTPRHHARKQEDFG